MSRFPKLTETFILRELEALERAGVPVTLVPLIRHREERVHPEAEPWMDRAVWSGWLSPSVLRDGARCLRRRPVRTVTAVLRVLAGSLTSPALLARTAALVPKALHLAEELRRREIDHVHAHFATHPTTVAWIVRQVADIDYSFTAHAHDIFQDTRLLARKIRDARLVRAISDHNARLLRHIAPDVPGERIRVLHLGVELPDAPQTSRDPAPEVGAPRLLAVAALRPYKGLDVLVDACAVLRDRAVRVECEIVGEGPLRASLEKRIAGRDLGTHLRLLGPLTQEEVRGRLARADLFAHPGVIAPDGQMDGIPVALMEAMAVGLPVVASDLSGIPELVLDRRNGLLVPPGDPGALADRIQALLDDPALRQRLGRGAARTVRERFHLDTNTERLAKAIDEVRPHTEPSLPGLLPDLLATAGWATPERVGLGRVRTGPDAEVLELTVTEQGTVHRLVLKRHRERPGAERSADRRAADEHRVLTRVRTALTSSPTLAAPHPVAVAGDSLLMTRCDGRRLDDLLREERWGTGADPADGPLLRTGRWLAALHRSFPAVMGNAEAASELESGILGDLDRIGAPETTLDDLRRVSSRLVASGGAAAEDVSVAGALCHGDFWPGNILVSRDRLTVLDFEGARVGVRAYDLAYFLIHLEALHRRPGQARRGAERSRRFLEGYGADVPLPLLRLARVAVAARLLANDAVRDGNADARRRSDLLTVARRAVGWRP